MEHMKKGLITVFLALFVAMAAMLPAAAVAGTTAERTLPTDPVAAGEDFTVTVDVSNYGSLGQVTETLPAGFDYVDSTGAFNAEVNGDEVTFTLISAASFTYTVTAADAAGNYAFAGTITDEDKEESAVTGNMDVEVVADGNGGNGDDNGEDCMAERTLPADPVMPDEEFTVEMQLGDYGSLAQVTETLPAGFDYVGTNAFDAEVDGDEVTFTMLGATDFEYTVTASDAEGNYEFAGTITDEDKVVSDVCGDTTVVVEGDGMVGCLAERTLPADPVMPNDEFTVEMQLGDYGSLAQVTETLPAGFDYVGTNAFDAEVNGDEVTFTLLGATDFEYTVTATDAEGNYEFAGTIADEDKVVSDVCGDTQVEIPPVVNATRDIMPEPAEVGPCDEFNVSITVENDGSNVNVVETIPEGFEVVSSTLGVPNPPEGNEVTFILNGETSFEYTVRAANEEGTYTFDGVVEDTEENEYPVGGETTIDVVLPEGIAIQPGWNFMSVPFELNNSSVGSVLADVNYDALVYYNASSGTWDTVTEFEPLKGYWIKSSDDCTQVIAEDMLEPEVPSVPATMTVYEGWNAIGYTDSMDILSAELVLGSIDDSYTTVKGPYNPATMSYEQVGHNGETGVISGIHVGTDVYDMGPYEGHWVYVTEETTLSGF